MRDRNNIFLYHLDHELQTLFQLDKYDYKKVYMGFLNVTKMAYLLCDGEIIVPISNYMESDLGFDIINSLSTHYGYESEFLSFASSSYNFGELVEKKQREHGEYYSEAGARYDQVLSGEKTLPGKMIKRTKSASVDIKCAWQKPEGIVKLANTIYTKYPGIYKASELEQLVGDVPSKLGDMAYISRYVTPFFERIKNNKIGLDNEINAFITQAYIKSFLDEYDAICITDIPTFDANCILPRGDEYRHISYRKCIDRLRSAYYKRQRADQFFLNCKIEELYDFKYSEVWKKIRLDDEISRQKGIIVEGKFVEMADTSSEKIAERKCVNIGIITALTIENAAMLKILGNTKHIYDERNRGNRYEIGEIESADGKKHKVALMMSGENNNLSAIACTEMLNDFPNMDTVIMCGIAAGIPNLEPDKDGVCLGDVIVADYIIQYDYKKETENGQVLKAVPVKSDNRLTKAVRNIEVDELVGRAYFRDILAKYAIEQFEKPDLSSDPIRNSNGCLHSDVKVFHGPIASANIVVKNEKLREEIRDKYEALAIEMEGSGIADASADNRADFTVVRGVCDYADAKKNDAWHGFASMSAAAYTYELIKHLPAKEI